MATYTTEATVPSKVYGEKSKKDPPKFDIAVKDAEHPENVFATVYPEYDENADADDAPATLIWMVVADGEGKNGVRVPADSVPTLIRALDEAHRRMSGNARP